MKVSVEISHYPLHTQDFIEPIRTFIDRLNTHPELVVQTNGMSTQVFGEYKEVMKVLTAEIGQSFANPYSVFVMKVVNVDLQQHGAV
jgi:uncharacterized protein YqgV (UPF0045/DUF77 family)